MQTRGGTHVLHSHTTQAPPPAVARLRRPRCCSCCSGSAEAPLPAPAPTSTQAMATVKVLAPPPPPGAFNSTTFAAAAPPAERLSPEQQREWAACVQQLTGLGIAEADAERLVARAFGWATQAYWRGEKVEEPPDAARAAGAVGVLRELGLSGAEVPRVIKAFPELLGRGPDALRSNLDKLRADWKLEGQVLARAVARQPAALGYTLDCEGSCVGECARCWARL